jgi:hypothetical protein
MHEGTDIVVVGGGIRDWICRPTGSSHAAHRPDEANGLREFSEIGPSALDLLIRTAPGD